MRIFHLKWPHFKHEENSLRGIRKARRGGFDAIDIDILITKDNVIVGCHWAKPLQRDGFHDPKHKIRRDARVRALTWEQLRRLTTVDGFHVQRLDVLLPACARNHEIAYLEPKADRRFEADWPWQHIRGIAAACGAKVLVRTLRNMPTPGAGVRRAEAARRNGFKTNLI